MIKRKHQLLGSMFLFKTGSKNFSEMVEDKCEKLLNEWVNKYGKGQDSVDKVVSQGF